MIGRELEDLIALLAKLPGLGPRSGRRLALHLLKNRQKLLLPFIASLTSVHQKVVECSHCYNIDVNDPCNICTNIKRDPSTLCVIADIADLWAFERANVFQGRYHVLGGTLSALDGIRPDDLKIVPLLKRLQENQIKEVILALNATTDGLTTMHYLADRLHGTGIKVSTLAHGVPVGGELDYLDDSTLSAAIGGRKNF